MATVHMHIDMDLDVTGEVLFVGEAMSGMTAEEMGAEVSVFAGYRAVHESIYLSGTLFQLQNVADALQKAIDEARAEAQEKCAALA